MLNPLRGVHVWHPWLRAAAGGLAWHKGAGGKSAAEWGCSTNFASLGVGPTLPLLKHEWTPRREHFLRHAILKAAHFKLPDLPIDECSLWSSRAELHSASHLFLFLPCYCRTVLMVRVNSFTVEYNNTQPVRTCWLPCQGDPRPTAVLPAPACYRVPRNRFSFSPQPDPAPSLTAWRPPHRSPINRLRPTR